MRIFLFFGLNRDVGAGKTRVDQTTKAQFWNGCLPTLDRHKGLKQTFNRKVVPTDKEVKGCRAISAAFKFHSLSASRHPASDLVLDEMIMARIHKRRLPCCVLS
jgi:hypothetical protein